MMFCAHETRRLRRLLLPALLLLCLRPARAQQMTYSTGSATVYAIPDNTPGGVSATVTVSGGASIASFDSLTLLGLSHPFLGDLVATLTHNGVTVDLFDHAGASETNFFQGSAAAFDGKDYTFAPTGANLAAAPDYAFAPDGTIYKASGNAANGFDTLHAANTLAGFDGQSVAGVWTVTLADRQSDDTGSFRGFAFTAEPMTPAPEPSTWETLTVGALLVSVLVCRTRRRARLALLAAALCGGRPCLRLPQTPRRCACQVTCPRWFPNPAC